MIEVRGKRGAILRAYNLFAPVYNSWARALESEAVVRGLARANVQPSERVLEVGVGAGAAFAKLRRQLGPSGRLFGLDLSPRMLTVARRHVHDAILVRGDARSLPFAGGSFDLLWSSYVLDLIPTGELVPLLVEFRRVLRPGGRLLLVNLSKEGDRKSWWERAYQLAPTWLVPYVFGGCRPVQAAPCVQQAGFSAIEREFVPRALGSEVIAAKKPL